MQKILKNQLLFFLALISFYSNAQDTLPVSKPNPIIFYEFYVGFGGANSAGWGIGGNLNYQFNRTDLVTARIGAFASYTTELALIAPTVGIPVFRRDEQIVDYGLLYGKRWIANGASFSVSAGLAYINHKYLEEVDNQYYLRKENLIGIPFEINLKFFKKQKRRLRLYYGIIPVTKKRVAFGRSFGFKVVGNISKANYTALGISYGFGIHKKY
jgi:hypothetical protein